ncbi:MAG TPA: hypothetical protein PKH24_17510 [Sedimentisphaerales bacterium]|jgi:hypothetical protein|nr:hypothetical protein [Sedimentisphaerales bacterium]HNU30730.1 hypothetical protein [Sedimentisphaerales bacterium]
MKMPRRYRPIALACLVSAGGVAIADAMKSLLAQESSALREHVEKGIYPLVSENQATDELGLSPKTEGCYYASLSPSTVVSTGEAFRSLDLDDFVGRLTSVSPLPILDEISVPDKKAFLKEYLWQWQDVLERAQARGWGILGHIG